MNSEFQYVQETAVSSKWRWSTNRSNVSSYSRCVMSVSQRTTAQTVRERGLWRFAIDEPSNDLVDESEAEPDRELAA